jgi:hypothetical protein
LAQTGDPGPLAFQGAGQRLHLAHAAAGLAQLDALVHRVLAFVAHKLDDRFLHRAVNHDGRTRMRLGAFQQSQSFGVQCAGLQHKHRNVELQAVDEVGDHHVFGAQAGGLGHGRELGRCALQQGLGLGQLGGKVGLALAFKCSWPWPGRCGKKSG